jgi:hypothetical protein
MAERKFDVLDEGAAAAPAKKPEPPKWRATRDCTYGKPPAFIRAGTIVEAEKKPGEHFKEA